MLFLLFLACALAQLAPVTSLPGIGIPATRIVSGFVTTNTTFGSRLFVVHVDSQSDPETDPTILWLQGGPGCSSMFGLFVELGPYIIHSDGSFVSNPWAWTRNANLVVVDSPPGTGFSTTNSSGGYDSSERAVALDLYRALQGLFAYNGGVFRRPASPLYIAGESYAGKYVPFLAATLLNTTVAPGDYKIPLQGLLLGNAWVAPQAQMKSYVPYLQLHGLCSAADAAWAEAQYPQFDALLAEGNYTAAADIDNGILARLQADGNISDPYNILDNPDPTGPRIAALQTYLTSAEVQRALNVAPLNPGFVFCGQAAYSALSTDEERFAGFQLRWAINSGLAVTAYNGDLDLICDWIGTRNYMLALGFNGQQAFNAAPNVKWTTISGDIGGLVQTA